MSSHLNWFWEVVIFFFGGKRSRCPPWFKLSPERLEFRLLCFPVVH